MAALAAAVVLVVVGGAVATIAVQAASKRALERKNDDLTKALTREAAANRRVEQRYALAVDAIKTFYTGVSEDFLLKEPTFKDLRDRQLKSATDFYGKLGALLGKESDLASRRALWQANAEVAGLTGEIGRPKDALAAQRQVLAAREALAAEFPADLGMRSDAARSRTAIAGLLAWIGESREAEEYVPQGS